MLSRCALTSGLLHSAAPNAGAWAACCLRRLSNSSHPGQQGGSEHQQGPPSRDSTAPNSPPAAATFPPPPPLVPQRHWLDHYLPGARQWLEEKNRTWWIKGLCRARTEQYHQLEGHEATLRAAIEREYVQLHDRYRDWVVDDRSETHLQVACLALASYKALMPFLRDEQEVLEIIREHMGARTSPALSFLMRAVKFLHKDGYVTLTHRLRGLQLDYGRAFASHLFLGEAESTLTISSCFYHLLYTAEGRPQLTACSCCSQDEMWVKAAEYRGVEAALERSIAQGDMECCFRVQRVGNAVAQSWMNHEWWEDVL